MRKEHRLAQMLSFIFETFSVFVLNNADREDFSVENYRAMQEVIMKIFEKSKLKFTGKYWIFRIRSIHIKTSQQKQN